VRANISNIMISGVLEAVNIDITRDFLELNLPRLESKADLY